MDTLACVLTELGELEPAIELLQRARRVESRGLEIEVHSAAGARPAWRSRRSAWHSAPTAGRSEGVGRARARRGPGPAPRPGGLNAGLTVCAWDFAARPRVSYGPSIAVRSSCSMRMRPFPRASEAALVVATLASMLALPVWADADHTRRDMLAHVRLATARSCAWPRPRPTRRARTRGLLRCSQSRGRRSGGAESPG